MCQEIRSVPFKGSSRDKASTCTHSHAFPCIKKILIYINKVRKAFINNQVSYSSSLPLQHTHRTGVEVRTWKAAGSFSSSQEAMWKPSVKKERPPGSLPESLGSFACWTTINEWVKFSSTTSCFYTSVVTSKKMTAEQSTPMKKIKKNSNTDEIPDTKWDLQMYIYFLLIFTHLATFYTFFGKLYLFC